MWFVYILKLNNGAFYAGITNDISRRIKKHQCGKGSKYVRSHLPLELVYVEYASGKSEAAKREYEIKSMTHAQKYNLANQGVKMSDKKCDKDSKKCDKDSKKCDKDSKGGKKCCGGKDKKCDKDKK